jgi:hypothetical protein
MLCPVRRPVARRFRPVALLAVVAMALLLAGCLGTGDDSAKLQQRARIALTRWADAVAAAGPSPVVLVGELTGQVGIWEEDVGDNNKRALMAGLVEADANLPVATPPDGEVRWQDGTTAPVALISARQAVAAINAGSPEPCGADCTPLRITGARLTTGPIETSRGSATGPVWDLMVDGTAVTVTRVAIADAIAVELPAWNPDDPPVGVAIDSASVTGDGRQLTVAFVGAPLAGDQPCGEDYTAEAVESDVAIVVIVTRHPHTTIGACTAVGAPRTATLRLAAPLGERTVLEVQQGRPVPVTLTP